MSLTSVPASAAATTVRAAATWRAARALGGEPRTARVVADGPLAVYVEDEGRCVAVLAADAVHVPMGLRTPLDRVPAHDGVLHLGAGRVALGDVEVRLGRVVDLGVPPLPGLGAVASGLADGTDAARLELPGAVLAGLAEGDPDVVALLLGRGTGLTPTGDDVLAGWLVARRAAGLESCAVAQRVRDLAVRRTTFVSAAMLSHALDGEATPALRTWLVRLAAAPEHPDEAARAALLAVGHTSGAGLALGVALALTPQTWRHP
ncbi:DUF2877 domain-containing protein [Solicola sp. PLA-1-18]|uniref:DUF2877 domain-containing protein n=1 Tax=Solicola sp. PLA-1-18 TaxID=3380532 RepID=UPI003B7F7D13